MAEQNDAADAAETAVRQATPEDWSRIWPLVRDVAREGETFAYDPELTEDEARRDWMVPPPGRVVVATTGDASVVGVANMYANRAGPGAHVASGSAIVDRTYRRRGVGDRLIAHMVRWCRSTGFAAIQFNAVVDTNDTAIRLYERHGFVTLGVAPGAFAHPRKGRVGLRIMWCDLADPHPG
jgi:GNAT superfamily N-acetyltransferase